MDASIEQWLDDGRRLHESAGGDLEGLRQEIEALEQQREALLGRLAEKQRLVNQLGQILGQANNVASSSADEDTGASIEIHSVSDNPTYAAKAGGRDPKSSKREEWHPSAA